MPQHREQPSHKKSQRNDEGHFRFATDAITKSDGDFNHAQRATAPHYRLKHNFEAPAAAMHIPVTGNARSQKIRISNRERRYAHKQASHPFATIISPNPAPP